MRTSEFILGTKYSYNVNHEMDVEFSNIASDKNFAETILVARPERKK